jgi:hypothetical protein
MAKINEQTLVITVSQLIKDSAESSALLNDDAIAQLEAVIAELSVPGALVEITQP